jgi:hypothetical protein
MVFISQEILESGSYMVLRDGQVRKLMVEKTIMEYNITVSCVSPAQQAGTAA